MGKAKKLVRKYATFLLVVCLSVILASYTFCNRQNKEQVLVSLMTQVIENYHFSPLAIDDDFSGKVYTLFLKRLDFNKRFFTMEDIKKLAPYKTQIDDEITNQSIEFYSVAIEKYYQNIEKIKGYYTEILSKPFVFNGDEVFETDGDKAVYPVDDAALKDAWYRALKYQVMVRLKDMIDIQEKTKSDSTAKKNDSQVREDANDGLPSDDIDSVEQAKLSKGPKKTIAQLEEDARKNVLKLHNEWFKRLQQMSQTDRFSLYLNAIANVFDPHTNYQTPSEKNDFDTRMSGQFEGIGAVLQAADSYVKVASLVPGGPAYLQGELKANDVILRVAQEKQEPVDIADMPLQDVVKLIKGKKGTKVTLTVKKVDGIIKKITITRDVVILEETFAKSAVIDGPHGKIGYINLPGFYQDFNNPEDGRSSASDVLKEIEKLKSENVSGIILDLRNNGGGALIDAVRMGGFFIPKGPIVQVKDKSKSPYVLDDTDPAVQYGGPLVVMVNSFSASASEILAAAMQDYHRAVIVGTNTFGKGTVQNQMNLDRLNVAQQFKPLGALLITIQKFYRINGGATQLKGVAPDVVIPDAFSDIEFGEREQDYCLPWNKINPASYSTWTGLPKFDEVVRKENEAISSSKDFQTIKEQAADLKKQRNETLVTLNMEKYKKQEKEKEERSKKYTDLAKRDLGMKVKALASDLNEIKGDSAKLIRNKNWIKDLSKDIQLKEAAQVINLINTTK